MVNHYTGLILLLAIALISCGDDDSAISGAESAADTPHSAADSDTNPAKVFPYSEATKKRFDKLLTGPHWSPASPPRNEMGMLEASHAPSGIPFVLIPEGEFSMGSAETESEGPIRTVRIGAFLMARTECTQGAWDRVGGEDARRYRGESLPVEGSSWNDARAWCAKAGLRLPSEAEWEYACRAGTTGKWSFGDEDTDCGSHAWFVGNSKGKTHPVGELRANPWGLHDVHGNVWEWCTDVWGESYDGARLDGVARTDGSTRRSKRGGALNDNPWRCRSAIRVGIRPGFRFFNIGFRPAASLD